MREATQKGPGQQSECETKRNTKDRICWYTGTVPLNTEQNEEGSSWQRRKEKGTPRLPGSERCVSGRYACGMGSGSVCKLFTWQSFRSLNVWKISHVQENQQ